MRLVIDGMGGDFAPGEIVKGVKAALEKRKIDIIITGDQQKLEQEFAKAGPMPPGVEIYHTTQIVEMDEGPAKILKEKKDSSLVQAANLVKDGVAAGMISAGNTGAALACGLLTIGRLQGVDRPGIGIPLPGNQRMALLLDGGANAECKPKHLLTFAQMGSLYMEKIMNRPNPRVGLLNVGSEAKKGSTLYQDSYALLSSSELNFIGNVEGRELFSDQCDVIVCDGFVGNITLKVTEGTAQTLINILKEQINKSIKYKIGALLLKGALLALKGRMDYEEYGGAPLLGLKAPVIICHGSSKAKAIQNAIFVGEEMLQRQVISLMEKEI